MKHLYRLFLIVVVLGFGLCMGGGETAVFALPGGSTGFQWVITVTIEKGQPNFIWNVYAWESSDLEGHLQTPLDCTIDPGVVIHQDHLSFNGSGAIHCPIPSFADDVAQLTNGAVRLPPYIVPEHLYVEANVTLPAPTANTHAMSLFSHPDFRYDTVVYGLANPNGMGGDRGVGEQSVVGGTTMVTTSQISVLPTTTLGIYKQGTDDYEHKQDGVLLDDITIDDKFLVGTGATMICIGCGPTGYFMGNLWYGEFDPGCTGICGI